MPRCASAWKAVLLALHCARPRDVRPGSRGPNTSCDWLSVFAAMIRGTREPTKSIDLSLSQVSSSASLFLPSVSEPPSSSHSSSHWPSSYSATRICRGTRTGALSCVSPCGPDISYVACADVPWACRPPKTSTRVFPRLHITSSMPCHQPPKTLIHVRHTLLSSSFCASIASASLMFCERPGKKMTSYLDS